MSIIQFLQKRPLLTLVPLSAALLISGCGGNDNKAASAGDLKAFNGENGKMPADFKAKMQAAQQNGQMAQQQASQAAKQKAAQQKAAQPSASR